MNSSNPTWPSPQRQTLSALMDGDVPPGELSAAIAGWQHDADARASWHAYHLIGDVLRSDDLAMRPARDEAFLQALRGRLAREPHPLPAAPLLATAAQPGLASADPLAPAAGRKRRAGWLMAPVALAAGFVAVAGLLIVTKLMAPDPAAAPQVARLEPAPGALVRDARLDRYLAAHRSLGSGLAGAGGAERTVQIVYEPK